MSSLDEALRDQLAAWRVDGRERRISSRRGLLDFVSNDYLGLAGDPRLIRGAREAAARYGAGGRAARLLGGGCELDQQAEELGASWMDAEAALLFPSGYQANLGLIPTLTNRGDLIISDELAHASLIDGARLSLARVCISRHADLGHVEELLRGESCAGRKFVVTEGVFSMAGDSPDLVGLARLCERYQAHLIIDEAHAVGLVGPRGAGAWAAAVSSGAPQDVLVARVMTGGKALGAAGALVLGSKTLRELLIQRARSFVFTTGSAPAVVGALLAGMQAAMEADKERTRVLALARRAANALGLPVPGAAIVPVPCSGNSKVVECAGALAAGGFDLRAIRPPTVPPGTECLRLVCHAHNAEEDVDRLAGALARLELPSTAAAEPKPLATPLVVAGTDTGIGKTVVAAALTRAALRNGAARYWKPVQTGPESDTVEVRRLAECAECKPAYELSLPASPHEAAAAEGTLIDPARLSALLAQRLAEDGVLIIELAGGVHVPLTPTYLQIDWLEEHGMPMVLVARSGLGTLNHTLLTLEALSRRGLRPRALILVGDSQHSNRTTLAQRSGLTVLELPTLEPLTPQALDRWLDAQDLGALLGERP